MLYNYDIYGRFTAFSQKKERGCCFSRVKKQEIFFEDMNILLNAQFKKRGNVK